MPLDKTDGRKIRVNRLNNFYAKLFVTVPSDGTLKQLLRRPRSGKLRLAGLGTKRCNSPNNTRVRDQPRNQREKRDAGHARSCAAFGAERGARKGLFHADRGLQS